MNSSNDIHPALSWALKNRGYETLTEVQIKVIEEKFRDPDLLVSAETGSGKTVAYGINVMSNLLNNEFIYPESTNVLALVIAPTRELALQIKNELTWLYEKVDARIASCVGGMDMRSERINLKKKPHIIVGTPGRLRDHIERSSLNINKIKAIVLDEADEMLDLGFREDLEYILQASPNDRRTLMFSATVPKTIEKLAQRYQNNVIRIAVQQDNQQHKDIQYTGYTIAPNDRENAIVNILRYNDGKNAIIFCSTRATVRHLTSRLNNRSFEVVALSGELNQNDRNKALQSMRDGRSRICVATDVAARGIDLPDLDLVLHADIPVNRQMLLHRSGRTGRAGRKGVSALLIPYNLRKRTERLFLNAKITPTWEMPPTSKDIKSRDQKNMLSHPYLTEPFENEENKGIETLTKEFSHNQIAAAFMRLYYSNLTPPEELIELEKSPRKQESLNFNDGVPISLSIGFKDNAAPKWIVAMLCRAGNITKNNIGKIEIKKDVTFIEISSESIDKFLKAIGTNFTIEDNIKIKVLDKNPIHNKQSEKRRFSGKRTSDNKRSDRRRTERRKSSHNSSKDDNRDNPISKTSSMHNKGRLESSSKKRFVQDGENREQKFKNKRSDQHISFKDFQEKENRSSEGKKNKEPFERRDIKNKKMTLKRNKKSINKIKDNI